MQFNKGQIPRGPEELVCPFHKKKMSEVCHKCPMWVSVEGKDPQSERVVEVHWHCSLAWTPWLLAENSQMQRQTGAAVEGLRNVIDKGIAGAQARRIAGPKAQPPMSIEDQSDGEK